MNKDKKDVREMSPEELEAEKERRVKRRRRRRAGTVINRLFGIVLATGIMVGIGGLAFAYVFLKGPSPSLTEDFAMTMLETRRFTFIPNLFLTEEEVQTIKDARNNRFESEMNFDLISIPKEEEKNYDENGAYIDAYGLVDEDNDGIIRQEIRGNGYVGNITIVLDPTRVFVGMPNGYGGGGLTLEDMCKKYDAIGGINGGSFVDEDGGGSGGLPDGLTIVDGVCYQDSNGNSFAGLTEDGVLYVGYYDREGAEQVGIKNGVSFGPVLVYNGEPQWYPSGLNPRTAIGQRGDGAILLLTIDGRQVHSIGASYSDLTTIMLNYGAINALNLDGGSSTTMYHKGEYIGSCSSANGVARPLPNAFLYK